MKTETIIKALLEAKKKHGKEKVQELLDAVMTIDAVSPCEGKPEVCSTGFYWSESLCRCVLEIG